MENVGFDAAPGENCTEKIITLVTDGGKSLSSSGSLNSEMFTLRVILFEKSSHGSLVKPLRMQWRKPLGFTISPGRIY